MPAVATCCGIVEKGELIFHGQISFDISDDLVRPGLGGVVGGHVLCVIDSGGLCGARSFCYMRLQLGDGFESL